MNKKRLWICLGLFLVSLVVGYGAYSFVGMFFDDNEDVVDNNAQDNRDDEQLGDNETDEVVDNENNSSEDVKDEEDNRKPATEVYNKVLHYSGNYLDISSELTKFDNGDEYKGKLLTLTVDKIKIDGKEYTFSWKNHPQHCVLDYDYMREGYNEFYINNKIFYAQNDQACYLEMAYYVTIINNKYIGVTFEGQGGNRMMVFDKNINLVDTLEYVNLEIRNNGIYFSEYVDDGGCVVNNYTYTIKDGKAVKTFKNKVNNTECNELTGDGCECNTDSSKAVKFELMKQNENIVIGNLSLSFIGVKIEDIYYETRYQYTLDILVNGKKINSNIFSNKNNKVIWSSNYAASFKVLELDNYYIITSFIAKQNDGSYVLILNKDGKVLKTFDDVGIKIDESNLSIEVTDCFVSNDVIQCPSQTYKLSELK